MKTTAVHAPLFRMAREQALGGADGGQMAMVSRTIFISIVLLARLDGDGEYASPSRVQCL